MAREMDLSYDPDTPRKPGPIASSPFWTGTGAVPGMRAPEPAAMLGLGVTPPSFWHGDPHAEGWMPIDQARRMLNNLAPSREAIADTLGVPMDGMAWVARQLGAKGIPGGYG